MLERRINMNKLNIKEYKTKGGEVRYILRGAYIGIDKHTGKQVRTDIRGRTKKGIKSELERLKNEFKKNGCVQRKESLETFSKIAEHWFNQYKLGVKPRTIQITGAILRTYILPALGNYKIEKITPVILQTLVNKWAKNASLPLNGADHREVGKGKNYKVYFRYVNKIYCHAVSLGIVQDNPCKNVLIPKVNLESTEKQVKFFNKEQLGLFFGYLDTLPMNYTSQLMKALCRLLVSSGLRVGEAMALSWHDINFKNNTVSVSKNTLRGVIQSSTKTKTSTRVVIIDNKAIAELKKWQNYQARHFFKLGNPHQSLVFPTKIGAVLDYQTMRPFLNRYFKDCNLPPIGFHGFRHSHASLLLNAGVSYKEIQVRLGHSSIKMTMDIYSHLEDEKQQQAVEIFERFANF